MSENFIKCHHCQYTVHSPTAKICKRCGLELRKRSLSIPKMMGGLALLGGLGAGTFVLRNRLPQLATTRPLTPQAQESSSTAVGGGQLQSAIAPTYARIAEVARVPEGIFNYGGSTTFAPLRSPQALSPLTQVFPQFRLRYVNPPTGTPDSGTGIQMLIQGQFSFAQSSRGLNDAEVAQAKQRGYLLEEIPVALDGIALFVHPKVVRRGVNGLTIPQIRDIFSGKVQNWRELGGANQAIVPVSRNVQTGTADFFSTQVLGKRPLGNNVREVRNTTEAIRLVSRHPGGIGYATAAESVGQQTVKLLGIAQAAGQPFISPCRDQTCTDINTQAIAEGTYPITRRLFIIVKRNRSLDEQAGVAYANMLLSDEGQQMVQRAGFVPIR
ncbi:MAG: PstS family phosphate ABC transporter substrate-binding protein [Thermosynechococcaceae cyanobacterium]